MSRLETIQLELSELEVMRLFDLEVMQNPDCHTGDLLLFRGSAVAAKSSI